MADQLHRDLEEVELEFELHVTRDAVAVGLIVLACCAASCGGYMRLGAGTTGRIGAALVIGALIEAGLVGWWMDPHRALRRLYKRIRGRPPVAADFHPKHVKARPPT